MASGGFEGTPIAQSLLNDDFLTICLLGVIVLSLLMIKRVKIELAKEFKHFATIHNDDNRDIKSYGIVEMIILNILTCFIFGLVFTLYLVEHSDNSFVSTPFYLQLLTTTAIIVAYIFLKHVLYAIVNNVFFNGNKNGQWRRSFFFLVALEGLLVIPSLIPFYYLYISIRTMAVYNLFVIILCKLLAFYRQYSIFFRQNSLSFQIFLYFCALEIVPLLALGVFLETTVDNLKVFF